jgi:hypothetical protein
VSVISKRQREQVVEPLRCAADDDGTDGVKTDRIGMHRAEILEAAARVEEGSWP